MSSLASVSISASSYASSSLSLSTYKLEVVARSICSSSALLVDDPNQPAMVWVLCVHSIVGGCGVRVVAFVVCRAASSAVRRCQMRYGGVWQLEGVIDAQVAVGRPVLGPPMTPLVAVTMHMHHRGHPLQRPAPHFAHTHSLSLSHTLSHTHIVYAPVALTRPVYTTLFAHCRRHSRESHRFPNPSPISWASTGLNIYSCTRRPHHTQTSPTRKRPIPPRSSASDMRLLPRK